MKRPPAVADVPIKPPPEDFVLNPVYDSTLRRWRMQHPSAYPGQDDEPQPKPSAPKRGKTRKPPQRGLGQVRLARLHP